MRSRDPQILVFLQVCLGISAPQILEFDVALSQFDAAWPKLWHKNGVFDHILGCSGHFDVALEKWAPVALKTFYRYGPIFQISWGGVKNKGLKMDRSGPF